LNLALYAQWSAVPTPQTVIATIIMPSSGSPSVSGATTVAKGATYAVSVAGSYSSYVWVLDGDELSGQTASSISLDTSAMTVGAHSLTVIATDASPCRIRARRGVPDVVQQINGALGISKSEATVTLRLSSSVSKTISAAAPTISYYELLGAASGSVSVTVTWPSSVAAGSSGSTSGVTYSSASTASGNYRIVFKLYSSSAASSSSLIASVTEIVKVRNNLSTTGAVTLAASDFTSAPAAPTSLTFTNGGSTSDLASAILSWADNSNNESGFVVEYSYEIGSTWTDWAGYGTDDADNALAGGTTSFTDASIPRSGPREFRVKAINSFGDSSWCESADIFTPSYFLKYSAGANDATGLTAGLEFKFGDTATLATCGFSRAGYSFLGWDVPTSSSSVFKLPGTKYELTTDSINAPPSVYYATLTAKWAKTPRAKIDLPNVNTGSQFKVSVSGNYLIVGADAYSSSKGAAYIYQRGASGGWSLDQTLLGSSSGDKLGYALNIMGAYAYVGMKSSAKAGAVAVYKVGADGSTWTQVKTLSASDSTTGDLFGAGLAVSSDNTYLAVGAPGVNKVYVFVGDGSGAFAQKQAITASSIPNSATVQNYESSFGLSLVINSKYLLIGAPLADVSQYSACTATGIVYLYTNSAGTWSYSEGGWNT
jgi:hypothetical protein